MNAISFREALNGVRYTQPRERTHVYDLPPGRDGVAERIEVTERPWWRGGTKVEARDAHGHILDANAWKTQVIVTDARTGIVTTLDRQTLDLEVKARSETRSRTMLGASEHEHETPQVQQLRADGTVRMLTNRYAREIVSHPAAPTPGAVVILPQEERYEETTIPPLGPASTVRVFREQEKPPVERGTLVSWVDQSGVLTIIGEDGIEQRHDMLIPLHAVERQGIQTCEASSRQSS